MDGGRQPGLLSLWPPRSPAALAEPVSLNLLHELQALASCQASFSPSLLSPQDRQVKWVPDQQLLTLSLWGLGVCLSVRTCLCVLVCTSSRRSRRGGLCGFGLRELVSRQWLWQPARPTIPGGWEGCRRDTLDLLVQWRLWRKRPLRPAFGTLNPSPTATLRPEEGPCPLWGKYR